MELIGKIESREQRLNCFLAVSGEGFVQRLRGDRAGVGTRSAVMEGISKQLQRCKTLAPTNRCCDAQLRGLYFFITLIYIFFCHIYIYLLVYLCMKLGLREASDRPCYFRGIIANQCSSG